MKGEWIPEAAVDRLREAAEAPDLRGSRYELVGPLGRGGMGAVFEVEDLELSRRVALKVLASSSVASDAAERLRSEARVLARLEHPGIVPVHDAGLLPDGRGFYVMKLVRGSRLDEHLRAGRPLAERLRVFGRICDAVAFAHSRGVIHRDLKPENVMVGPFGEVLVMDWGLAKALGPAEPTDRRGAVLGTPGYMAPEQARGEADRVDERTDVYALGAILRFLSKDDPSVPRPVAAIVRKATAEDPPARYAAVGDLAADVERFLDGAPVSALPEGVLDRARRLASKHRTAILLVAAYLLVRVVLLVVARR